MACEAWPQEVIDFEELFSELITIKRMLRLHLGSRLLNALLTYGVLRRILSCEERCGRTIANPIQSTCVAGKYTSVRTYRVCMTE